VKSLKHALIWGWVTAGFLLDLIRADLSVPIVVAALVLALFIRRRKSA
jgi:hypothetical protein